MALTDRLSIAARALLGWSQEEMARHSKVAPKTIADLERGQGQRRAETEAKLRGTFEAAGIEFIDEDGPAPGVRIHLKDWVAPVVEVEGDKSESGLVTD
jgi:transcriptional regulator with XRE-family HTH domain